MSFRGGQGPRRGAVLIALGSNLSGPWGDPEATVRRAIARLSEGATRILGTSRLHATEPVGQPGQAPYVNAVAEIETHLPPEALLRRLKRIEREAGRRGRSAPWGARTLDLDIVDYRGLVQGWRHGTSRFARPGARPLVLPHPQAHRRSFVLSPLLEVAPGWRHPVLRRTAASLLSTVANRR